MVSSLNLSSNAPISPPSAVGAPSATGAPGQDGVIKLDQIEIGKALQAQVLSVLSNGNSMISFPNGALTTTMQMRLPPGFQVGDQIQLTLLSLTEGKPSFSISLAGNPTETVNLSSTAQLLDKIASSSTQPPKITSNSPLLATNKDMDPAHLASQLNASIDKSGVFYESHLQQWNEGARLLDQIQQEPQNQSTQPAETANNLIPAQLDTLENKRLTWQGELYPGQPLQLEIQKDEQKNHQSNASSGNTTDPVWQTSLKLSLPQLGQVQVKIRLQGDHVQLNVNAADPTTANTLKSASDNLNQALAASGTALDLLTVQSDGEA